MVLVWCSSSIISVCVSVNVSYITVEIYLWNSCISYCLPPPVSPIPSPYGTMVKEYLWWSTRMRRCSSQLSFLATCSPPVTMMMTRKRSQVRRAISFFYFFISGCQICSQKGDWDLFLWPQVEGTGTVPNSATSSVPNSPWKQPVRNTDTASNRWEWLFY